MDEIKRKKRVSFTNYAFNILVLSIAINQMKK